MATHPLNRFTQATMDLGILPSVAVAALFLLSGLLRPAAQPVWTRNASRANIPLEPIDRDRSNAFIDTGVRDLRWQEF